MGKQVIKVDISDSLALKDKVVSLLAERSQTLADLMRALPMSKSGLSTMWSIGTISLGALLRIADFLKIPGGALLPDRHRGEVLKSAPGDRPYVEDRIAKLESDVRSLRNELKNQVKKR